MKILDLRRGLVSEGRTSSDKLAAMFTTMERSPHNAWGFSQQVRRKLLESESLPLHQSGGEWLLWLGCGCSYDPHGHDVVKAMQKILDAAACRGACWRQRPVAGSRPAVPGTSISIWNSRSK